MPVAFSAAELSSVPFDSVLVPARLRVPVSVTTPPSIEVVSSSVSVPSTVTVPLTAGSGSTPLVTAVPFFRVSAPLTSIVPASVLSTISLSSVVAVPVAFSAAELSSVPFDSVLVPARLRVPVSVTTPPSIEVVSSSVSVPSTVTVPLTAGSGSTPLVTAVPFFRVSAPLTSIVPASVLSTISLSSVVAVPVAFSAAELSSVPSEQRAGAGQVEGAGVGDDAAVDRGGVLQRQRALDRDGAVDGRIGVDAVGDAHRVRPDVRHDVAAGRDGGRVALRDRERHRDEQREAEDHRDDDRHHDPPRPPTSGRLARLLAHVRGGVVPRDRVLGHQRADREHEPEHRIAPAVAREAGVVDRLPEDVADRLVMVRDDDQDQDDHATPATCQHAEMPFSIDVIARRRR